jgi:predicted TPR repeat methyltransferase
MSFLGETEHTYDLIVAADVVIYFGDLKHLFAAASAKLAPGALFAFSVERSEAAETTLRDSLRFAHSAGYVASALSAAGLELANMEEAVLRKDRGADVEGLLVVAKKPAEVVDGVKQETKADQTFALDKLN